VNMKGGVRVGKDISAQETSASEGTRLPQAYENTQWAQCISPPPRARTQEALGIMKVESLKENRDFKRLYYRGQSVVGGCMVLYVMPNRLGVNRLGITASTKIGCAVKRNRARRRLKECYRALGLRQGLDIVVVARARAVTAPFTAIEKEMRSLFYKLKML